MIPERPFWMFQRQIKLEPGEDNRLLLTAPNLPDHEIVLTEKEGSFAATLARVGSEGEENIELAVSDALSSTESAWNAGFELMRRIVIT